MFSEETSWIAFRLSLLQQHSSPFGHSCFFYAVLYSTENFWISNFLYRKVQKNAVERLLWKLLFQSQELGRCAQLTADDHTSAHYHVIYIIQTSCSKCLSIKNVFQYWMERCILSSSKQCIIPDPSKALECKFRSSLVDFFWVWLWGLFSRILWVEVVQSGLLLLLFKTKPDLKTSRCMSMFVMKSIWFKNPEGLYLYLDLMQRSSARVLP